MEDGSPVTFGYSTPFGLFMDSLIEKGFPEDELPNLEDGEALELSALAGKRFRFKQQVDEKGTAKFGKRVSGAGKNKREYDRTNTVIDAVLGATGKATTSTGKTSGKKSKASDEDTLKEEAADVLKDVLAKEPVNRKNLSLPVTKALMKNENKDALKKIVLDEDWQDEQDWLTVDKKGNLSVE